MQYLDRNAFYLFWPGIFNFLSLCICYLFINNCFAQTIDKAENRPASQSEINERNAKLKAKLQGLYCNGIKVPNTVRDIIYNDGKRMGNLISEYPDKIDRSKVIVTFVNIPRPYAENDIWYDYIYNAHTSNIDSEEYCNTFETSFFFLGRFCTDDVRLWSLAKEIVESSASSHAAFSVISNGLAFMGMCRTSDTKLFFERATSEEYWRSLVRNKSEKAKADLLTQLNFIRHAVVFAITNLPAEDALPILERISKGLTSKDYIYEVTWRALDEMWRRKNGDPPLFIEHRTRYEYDDPEALPSAYPEWIYGVGGKKIEWPFGQPPAGYTPPRLSITPF